MADPNYPTSYEQFMKEVDGAMGYSFHLGFTGGPSAVFRFCNRFRLAKAFSGLSLDGYSDATVAGYNGLASVFLAWSAFELFCQIDGNDQYSQPQAMDRSRLGAIRTRILQLDQNGAFRGFLKSKVNQSLKGRIEAFENGDDLQTPFIAAAVRHIFGHGHLSAHPKEADPKEIKEICDELRTYLLEFMDTRFTSRVSGNG